jgi:hypothetical protein
VVDRKSAAAFFVLTILLSISIMGTAYANPLPPTRVTVHSPKNDALYPSSTIQLSFTPIPGPDMNFTSFTYVLDDQTPVATNGTSTLTGLKPGMHTLKIYCSYEIHHSDNSYSFLNKTYTYKDEVANVVYFSTQYSTAWITFDVMVICIGTIVPLSLFFNRRQIVVRLRGRKTGAFWFGALLFGLGSLASVSLVWKIASDILFPYWPRGLSNSPFLAYFVYRGVLGFCGSWFVNDAVWNQQ